MEAVLSINVTLFAWNHGYAIVEQAGTWNGYDIYLPKHVAESASPTVILANESEVRFAEPDEAAACIA